jgi:glycine cleavage system transcriptional repressor
MPAGMASGPPLLAVTVLGHDRPGIIADVTAVLASLGGNLEDSTMTLLRGHFAMTLVVACAQSAASVESALRPVTADSGLMVSVREIPPEASVSSGSPYLLTVHGADRPGIVSAVTRVCADVGANITDLSTRLSDDLYLLIAEVDIPASADIAALTDRLLLVARELGVEASLRPVEADVL